MDMSRSDLTLHPGLIFKIDKVFTILTSYKLQENLENYDHTTPISKDRFWKMGRCAIAPTDNTCTITPADNNVVQITHPAPADNTCTTTYTAAPADNTCTTKPADNTRFKHLHINTSCKHLHNNTCT